MAVFTRRFKYVNAWELKRVVMAVPNASPFIRGSNEITLLDRIDNSTLAYFDDV